MEALLNKLLLIWSDYRYLIAAGVYVIWLLFSWFVIKLFERSAARMLKRASAQVKDLILKQVELPLWLILIIIGFSVVSRTVGLPAEVVPYIDKFTQLAIVFIVIYFFIELLVNLSQVAGRVNPGAKNLAPTFSRIANIVLWGIGILMLMEIFGISITPLLASLGIAGLAIGLALQDTLGNFFAGTYILLNRPIRLGDYIELENGLKGYVAKIGWRETEIRTLPNNAVIVPNSKLSQSIITNYHIPDTQIACLVQVGVSYDSDLAKVEKVTVAVAKKIMEKTRGGIKSFEPFIRYHTFADFSIKFTVIMRVEEYVDKYFVTHEFIKALHQRYKEEGIVIPFPIRTIQMEKS